MIYGGVRFKPWSESPTAVSPIIQSVNQMHTLF